MKTYKVKLKFRGPVHLGNKEGLYNFTDYIVHSDTLFSALINCYALLYGVKRADELVDCFLKGEYPFKISSGFLYLENKLKNGRVEYFIPKPLDLDLFEMVRDHKIAKKIKYIPLRLLLNKDLIKNLELAQVDVKSNHLLIKDNDLPENTYLFKIIEKPRVTVDRLSFSSEIYYTSGCYFDENAGLWFYLELLDEGLEKEIKASIRLLGDEGLGGERTYGFGIFEPKFEEDKSLDAEPENGHVALSLIYPEEGEEIYKKLNSYNLLERAGYTYSIYAGSQRRKKIRMISEGSTFLKVPKGSVVDVTPPNCPHRIVKYGIAYTISF